MSPNVDPLSVGMQSDGLVVKASALKNYDLSLGVYGAEYLTHPANVITTKPFEDRFGMATMDLPTVFPIIPTEPRQLTEEEIEKLIEKSNTKKGGLGKEEKEQILEIYKEIRGQETVQEAEK